MNYKVYQGDELKQTVTSKIAVMNGLQPNKSYVFGVYPDNGQTGAVGANLIIQSELKSSYLNRDTGGLAGGTDFHSDNYIATNGETVFTFSSPDYVFKGSGNDTLAMYDSDKNYLGYQLILSATQTLSKSNVAYIRFSINFTDEGSTTGNLSDWLSSHRYKLEKGSVATRYVATTSVTTRGIRFNIPKTLIVESTITLRYEEYPLGIVPIGNEPSGYFGGGSKQNLSAKVISTANGSSVVEVAGNVIEVGGTNLIIQSELKSGYLNRDNGVVTGGNRDFYSDNYIATNGETVFTFSSPDYVFKGASNHSLSMYDSDKNYLGWQSINSPTQTLSKSNVTYIRFSINFTDEGGTYDHLSDWLDTHRYKLEPGTISTPYASFVDGDTFTAQPDGTCALFSEHKALYY